MISSTDSQNVLRKLGYVDVSVGGDITDGEWKVAIQRFQADLGMHVDGIVGELQTGPALGRYFNILSNAPPGFTRTNRWRLTNYFVPTEADCGGPATVPIYDTKGNILSMVSAQFFVNASLEGTARLKEGRLINVTGVFITPPDPDLLTAVFNLAVKYGWFPDKLGYAGIHARAIDGTPTGVMTFSEILMSRQGKGYGTCRGIPLEPFRTVAADLGLEPRSEPRFKGKGGIVAVGTSVWCPDLVGRQMPDGTVHDGYLVVNDTGGGINGAHFDIFVGQKAWGCELDRLLPKVGHIWFSGLVDKLDINYIYGI